MTKADQRAKEYESHLRFAGVRMTKQRLAILRVLAETDSHPDANEIFHIAFAVDASISLSSVYRTERSNAMRSTMAAPGLSMPTASITII